MINYILIAALSLVLCGYYLFLRPLSPHEALPQELRSQYKEYYWEAGFLPDFVYCLRVQATEEQFRTFADKLELQEGTSFERMSASCRYKRGEDGASVTWWTPPELSEAIFVYQSPDTTHGAGEILVYDGGDMYFAAWIH